MSVNTCRWKAKSKQIKAEMIVRPGEGGYVKIPDDN